MNGFIWLTTAVKHLFYNMTLRCYFPLVLANISVSLRANQKEHFKKYLNADLFWPLYTMARVTYPTIYSVNVFIHSLHAWGSQRAPLCTSAPNVWHIANCKCCNLIHKSLGYNNIEFKNKHEKNIINDRHLSYLWKLSHNNILYFW